jgi:hypothetical protein
VEGKMPTAPRRSLVVWRASDGSGDTPGDILRVVIERLRAENRLESAREISLAIQRCEEGLHWIRAIEERRAGGQDAHED